MRPDGISISAAPPPPPPPHHDYVTADRAERDAAHNPPGQTLAQMATPAQARRNAAPPDPTSLDAKVQATDTAAQRVQGARKTYDEAAAATNGIGAALPYLAQNLADARSELEKAVDDEVRTRVDRSLPPGHSAAEAEYAYAGGQVAQRFTGDAATLVGDTVSAVSNRRQVNGIVALAQTATDPAAAIGTLNAGLAGASPAVRDAVLARPEVQAMVQRAGDWAAGALTDPRDEAYSMQAPALRAMQRLDQLTKDADPALAARIVARALPCVESFVNQNDTTSFGQAGVETMVHVLDRVGDSALGRSDVDRFAALGLWNDSAVYSAIAQGATPAYAVALAKQPGVDGERVMQTAFAGMSAFRDKIAGDAKDYGEHMQELGWLIANHGGIMTPQQLDRAIADYAGDKGADWQAKSESLRSTLADDGVHLMAQVAALQTLPALPSSLKDEARHTIEDALNDPKDHLAITLALQRRPDLTTGAQGERLLNFFADAQFVSTFRLTDQARKLASEFATARVKTAVMDQIGSFDPADPASVARTREALEGMRDSRFARTLGVSPSNLDQAIDHLERSMPQAGETAAQTAQRVTQLNKALDGVRGFDKATLAGQLMRTVGIGLAGVGFLASATRTADNPTLKNGLGLIVSAAGLGQKGTELLIGLGKVDAESTLGRLGGGAASKFLGVLSAGLDVWSAADAFGKGDIPSGVLYGVGAGGGLLAAFGSGSLAGPIGIGLVAVSVLGLGLWNSTKEANQHEPGSDHGVSMRFLQHAGFSERTARALCDQSGDGRSAVPLLERYAELKGLHLDRPADRQRLVDWIEAMPPERLSALRDDLHHELDDIDGDVSRFKATASDDDFVVPDTAERPWFAATGSAAPHSVAQLDAMLRVLELPAL